MQSTVKGGKPAWLVLVTMIGLAVWIGSDTPGPSIPWPNPGGPVTAVLAAEDTRNGVPSDQPDSTTSPQAREQADVVVVGAGISGLAAALDLGRGGSEVLVLDMSSVFGGHAVMSQGSVSIVDSPTQRKFGIQDSPDLAYQDFHRWGEDPNSEWVRYYCDHSRADIHDWLDELGVRFAEVLASSGNSVPREHQPIGRGIGLVTPIYRGCLEQETVRFRWNSKVEQLQIRDGRIHGVVARDTRTGKSFAVDAAAVVLATGGFQSNLEMVRDFWPAEFKFPKKILAGSGINSIGLGHQLARKAGGEFVHMDYQWNYFTGLPDPRHPESNRGLNATNLYGILVNSDGERFANFHGWAREVMPLLLKQREVTCWCIFDEATRSKLVISGSDWADFSKVDRLILQNPKLVKKAATLEELAQLSGLPADKLVRTVARYNQLVDHGTDTDFGRFGPGRPEFSNQASPKLEHPPYYAMQTYPLTRKSMGGVAIDLACHVLTKEKQAIPGLYAVGELTGLAGVNGKAALEGTFLGPCIVTGRVAARDILKQLASKLPPPAATASNGSCRQCHDISKLLAAPREGFWHFESVHRVSQEKGWDCRNCHSELAPYNAESHHIQPLSLSTSCATCHTARE